MVVYIWQQWLQLYSLCQAFFYFFRGFFILVFLFSGRCTIEQIHDVTKVEDGCDSYK